MTEIAALWERLEAWGKEHAPKMLEDLNPGAGEDDLAKLEAALGRKLPEALLQSLAIHNGESDGWPNKVFADLGAYYSCDAIVEHWRMRVDIAAQLGDEFSDEERVEQAAAGLISISGPVKAHTYHRDWIPIMDCNGDVVWALDFAPGDGGEPGQVIQVDLEACDWRVLAPSFDAFFAAYVESLEAGDYPIVNGLPTKASW